MNVDPIRMNVAPPREVPEVAPGIKNVSRRLKAGDRYPLVKTVEQTLEQQAPNGPTKSHSRLELQLLITVDQAGDDGCKRLTVHYQHVHVDQDLSGQVLHYDSHTPAKDLAPSLVPYSGLAGNAFSFDLGPDNRVVDLVGFDDFLKRCLNSIPNEFHELAREKLAHSGEGIANFVDDSVGLLPPRGEAGEYREPHVGEVWKRTRDIARPVPMHVKTRYTLRELTDAVARVDVSGSMTPAATFGPAHRPDGSLRVTLLRGTANGTTTIDRGTGLPTDSKIERHLDMLVTLPDGRQFDQHKHAVTTIRAIPPNGGEAKETVGAASETGLDDIRR